MMNKTNCPVLGKNAPFTFFLKRLLTQGMEIKDTTTHSVGSTVLWVSVIYKGDKLSEGLLLLLFFL